MIGSKVSERYLSVAYLVTVIVFNSKRGYYHHCARVTLVAAFILWAILLPFSLVKSALWLFSSVFNIRRKLRYSPYLSIVNLVYCHHFKARLGHFHHLSISGLVFINEMFSGRQLRQDVKDFVVYQQETSGSSSPLCLRILKEGSGVRQKHNCLVILFIAEIATTCFGRAWPSSGHYVDVYK
jgi:hypothetical protein